MSWRALGVAKAWATIQPCRSQTPGGQQGNACCEDAGQDTTRACYVFLINRFKLAAGTIAEINKARWQVALFFKWLKQNLKIKSFSKTSEHAVMTQIWIALCVYLLPAFINFQSKLKKHAANTAPVAARSV